LAIKPWLKQEKVWSLCADLLLDGIRDFCEDLSSVALSRPSFNNRALLIYYFASTVHKDGSTLCLSSNAVHPMRYPQGVDSDGAFTTEIKVASGHQ
jgi:hypothetical protein